MLSSYYYTVSSVSCLLEKGWHLGSLVCDVTLCFVTFAYIIWRHQVWYFIVSIPDLCHFLYFQKKFLPLFVPFIDIPMFKYLTSQNEQVHTATRSKLLYVLASVWMVIHMSIMYRRTEHTIQYLHFHCESLNEPLHLRSRSHLQELINSSYSTYAPFERTNVNAIQ